MTSKEYFMIKLASEKTYSERRRELKILKKQIKKIKPQTEREKRIERLAGKKWTTGQYVRGAGIGATVGTLGHVLGSAIEGKKALPITGRGTARAAAVGALFGAALPAATRLANIEAAKRGKF